MVSCYQNATGIELLDDYCFVIHNQASPGELFLCDCMHIKINITDCTGQKCTMLNDMVKLFVNLQKTHSVVFIKGI